VSVLLERIQSMLGALGYLTHVEGGVLIADNRDPLTRNATQRIMAGQARSLRGDDILIGKPDYVVVEDSPPAAHVERLTYNCGMVTAELVHFGRFVDRLWHAEQTAQDAIESSRGGEDISLPPALAKLATGSPQQRYADQDLSVEDEATPQNALVYCEGWLGNAQGLLVVFAAAGVGKSQLTRVLQWRSATDYLARTSHDTRPSELPPIALRIRLRELDTLSLRAIVDYLRPRTEDIRNAQVLSELLRLKRVVLLLDGLDELTASLEDIIDGLKELLRLAEAGARIMLTSRSGYITEEPVKRLLRGGLHVISELRAMEDRKDKLSLLQGYGASAHEASNLVGRLPPNVVGIPLFLLWGYASGYGGDGGAARSQILWEMVRRFCERDERRVGLDSSTQVAALKNLAYHRTFFGPLSKDELLENWLGVEGRRFVEGPHALLREMTYPDSSDPDTDIERFLEFRDATFEDLFLSYAIVDNWREQSSLSKADFGYWFANRLGEKKLSDLTEEFLAEELTADELREAWTIMSQAPLRYRPFARRNILGIALERLAIIADKAAAPERARSLASMLGDRDISDTILSGLTITRIDFRGWDLGGCKGSGAQISGSNFVGATFDDSLRDAEILACNGLEGRRSEQDDIRRGRGRFDFFVVPWQDHAAGFAKFHARLASETPGLDPSVMSILADKDIVVASKGRGGRGFWSLTQQGEFLIREFLTNRTSASELLQEIFRALGKPN
jgi:hypothetical protein